MEKIIVEIGRTLGKAVLAGLGVELARLASLALRKKLTPKEEAEKAAAKAAAEAEAEQDLTAENEKLKAELEQLKTELAARSSRD
jgi:cell division protein FtsB